MRLLVALIALLAACGGATTSRETRVAANLQAAIDAARPGDTLVVSGDHHGPITLPEKPGAEWITLRGPARILAPDGQPAIQTAPRAHHYKLVDLEILPVDPAARPPELVRLGTGDQSAADVPHHFELEALNVHGLPEGELKRGMALNAAHVTVRRSRVTECRRKGDESQAIAIWNGPGPLTVVDSVLQAGGENFLAGGADPSIPDLVPADIEIRGNTMSKPPAWRGVYQVKNLLELKNARRVRIVGNTFEDLWPDAQKGSAILFTTRNQDGGAPWSTVEVVTFEKNVVRRAPGGVNLLDAKNITIRDNTFELDGGFFVIISGGSDVTITGNRVSGHRTLVEAYGASTPNFRMQQ